MRIAIIQPRTPYHVAGSEKVSRKGIMTLIDAFQQVTTEHVGIHQAIIDLITNAGRRKLIGENEQQSTIYEH